MNSMKYVSALLMITLSFSAYAGIKDKKAQKAAEAAITAAAAKAKTACGNASLAAKVDWSSWKSYDYKKLNKDKAEIIRNAGILAEGVIGEMATLCKDADYKEELAKITTLNISGKKDQADYYVAFKLDGTALKMEMNADGVGSWKNAQLLKAVWE